MVINSAIKHGFYNKELFQGQLELEIKPKLIEDKFFKKSGACKNNYIVIVGNVFAKFLVLLQPSEESYAS